MRPFDTNRIQAQCAALPASAPRRCRARGPPALIVQQPPVVRLRHGGEVDEVTVADVDGGQPIFRGGLGKRGQGIPELAGGVREAQRGGGTPEQGAHMVRSTGPGLLDQVVPQGRLLDQGEGGQRVEQIDGHGTLRRIEMQRPADHGGVGETVGTTGRRGRRGPERIRWPCKKRGAGAVWRCRAATLKRR
ncbi:hypothetical protein EYB53_019675 [Candidatus Chloroploca sp. M-50]|uniref:Uncharacterized protein n=1 Tax=Candidatus Chloroploca mongolica TaxID=2528176 RepID=A0ABS4DES0_9CHLR|nr:hypothetical protein [Candidatus Chloroploca mongolica]MBP1467946.1 hypothetical protein [Candidatus Chloroploca mongolica]